MFVQRCTVGMAARCLDIMMSVTFEETMVLLVERFRVGYGRVEMLFGFQEKIYFDYVTFTYSFCQEEKFSCRVVQRM
jgi:uncharacterized membrane protein